MTLRVDVDGTQVDVRAGATVLEAVHATGGELPTLCFDERLEAFGACRVCMVGVRGAPGPVAACTTRCRDEMVIDTTDETARRIAAATVELVLSELPEPPGEDTELAVIARQLGVGRQLRWPGEVHQRREDLRHPYLALRQELCISCGRCVRACDEVQGAFALTAVGRGFESSVVAGLDEGFRDSSCVSCGACADTCPTAAISEISLLEMIER